MNRREIVLAALATWGEGIGYSPIHAQKVLFLFDRESKDLVGAPFFNFSPYDYGLFDRAVYEVLCDLEKGGFVELRKSKRYREYFLTVEGYRAGTAELNKLPEQAENFLRDLVEWVRELSFSQLVSRIYDKYPDMKENSVFRS